MDLTIRNRRPILLVALVIGASGLSGPAVAEVYTNDSGQRVECHYEHDHNAGHPVADPVAGAVVGGVVGHQFGKGNGKDVATGVGAVGGAMAGSAYNDKATQGDDKKVCHPVS